MNGENKVFKADKPEPEAIAEFVGRLETGSVSSEMKLFFNYSTYPDLEHYDMKSFISNWSQSPSPDGRVATFRSTQRLAAESNV